MEYYAHSTNGPLDQWQPLKEHLLNTAEKAKVFATKFGAGELGYLCGLLHDIGKYSDRFQQKLRGTPLRVDHSSAGAQLADKRYGIPWNTILAYCIAGHHSGLLDYGTPASTQGTLLARLSDDDYVKESSAYRLELENIITAANLVSPPVRPLDSKYQLFTISFFIRMLYSCLVDADFLDTEAFMSVVTKPRSKHTSVDQLKSSLEGYLNALISTSPPTRINAKRKQILQRCLAMAEHKPGLFTLTVPTGGGKTFSSLAFALAHAQKYCLERVIYVIPYTSIIEQNAGKFREAIGADSVLEHHSNYQFEDSDSEQAQNLAEKLKLAAENWDIPLVVTTNVQFFESLFSNRSSRTRKLHNIAKSVVIFDEVQMLPVSFLRPCLLAISELVHNYSTTAVFCTATQPAVSELLPQSIRPIEIMENPEQLYCDFKKVRVVKKGRLSDDELAQELNALDQVLCIVNTRKHARELFSKLNGSVFHLSTLMCPVHRHYKLDEIRNRLKSQLPCRVVSTQLIEAGVDVDFPVVYRAMAGIDSIVQSAGRCNREGNLDFGTVYVFEPDSAHARVRGYLRRTADIAEMVMRRCDDPISLEAIACYFNYLYEIEGDEALDQKRILSYLNTKHRELAFQFKTVAEEFRLIDSNTYPIIVPYDDTARQLINQARYTSYPLSLARKLQPYTVNVYEQEYEVLQHNGSLEIVNGAFAVLSTLDDYSCDTGLKLPQLVSGEAIFV